MRHKLNLPDQPNVVFLIIVFDIIALAAVYGLYGTNWVGQVGQEVELNQGSLKPLKVSERNIVLKVFEDTAPNCILGKTSIPLQALEKELTQAISLYQIEEVLLMIDKNASVERKLATIDTIQGLDLKCSIVYETSPHTND